MNLELIREIAEYITEEGLERTSNGSYYAYYEELAKEFHVSFKDIRENAEDIIAAFDYDIVAEADYDYEAFDIMFYLQYCCEHCSTYQDGDRCYEECSACDCWCDSFEEDEKDEDVCLDKLEKE